MRRLRFSFASLNRAVAMPGIGVKDGERVFPPWGTMSANTAAPGKPSARGNALKKASTNSKPRRFPLRALLFGLLCLSSAVMAQPANDNFSNATTITGPSGSLSDSNVGGTLEPGEPSMAGNPGGQSVWYAWTAPSDMTITFNTVGSDF